MDRLLKYVGDNYQDLLNEKLNLFMIEHFDFNDYYLEQSNPNTENIFMSENELFFDVKIPIKAIKKNKKSDEILNTDIRRNCYISCRFLLNGEFTDFEIVRVGDEPSDNRPSEVSIQVDSNLMPRDKKYPMYEDASELLNRLYTDDEIRNFINIPIRDIIKRLGLEIIDKYNITLDNSCQARVSLNDETVVLYESNTKEQVKKKLKAGTILVDASYLKKKNTKAVNFSLAHELYHWLRHRYFVILRNLVNPKCEKYLICNFSNTFCWYDENSRVESQANKFAGTLLLSQRTLALEFNNRLWNYKYHIVENKQDIIDRILKELSDLYQVNPMVIAIRLSAAKIYFEEFEKYKYDFNNRLPHYEISFEDLIDICLDNKTIYNLVIDKKIVYKKKHLVINSEKYNYKGKASDDYTGCIRVQYEFIGNRRIYNLALAQNKLEKKPLIDNKENSVLINEAKLCNTIDDVIEMKYTILKDSKTIIADFRKKRKLTQEDMMDLLDIIDRRKYQRYENMEIKIPQDILLKFIRALKIPMPISETLMNETNNSLKNDKKSDAIRVLLSQGLELPIAQWDKIIKKYE